MSKRRLGDYSSGSSTKERFKTEENRRPYSGRVLGSARPEPEIQREYDTRSYYDGDGGRGRHPVTLSGFSIAALPLSESTSMKFQWNNLMAQRPDGSNNANLNLGLNRSNFGFSESDAYRLNAENGYGGGGSAKSGIPNPGVDPTRKYGYFRGGFASPLSKSHEGAPKVDNFRHGDHHSSSGFIQGFRGLSDEFNRSREMAAIGPVDLGGYCSQGQTPRLNGWVDPNWAQHSQKGDYNAPVKRSENGDMGTLSILGNGIGEDPRPPAYLRPSIVDTVVDRIDGVNGSLRAGAQEISELNQYHNFVEQPQPTIPSYQSLRTEQSLVSNDEVLGSSLGTRHFGFGGDDGLERGLEALSYEGTLKRLALVKGDQGLDDVTTLQMCAMRKRALAKRRRGNDSKSGLFPDLSASCNVPDLSYGDNQLIDEDIEQYATIGADQWNIDQAGTCGDGHWHIDQDVNFGEDPVNINQNVNFGEDHRNMARDVAHGEGHWNVNQGLTYGEHQLNAEDIIKLSSDSLLPSSKLPAPMQEHHGEPFKSARVNVKKRLGPLKSPGSIKKHLGHLRSSGSVKKAFGTFEINWQCKETSGACSKCS